jgi:hypothetical protein
MDVAPSLAGFHDGPTRRVWSFCGIKTRMLAMFQTFCSARIMVCGLLILAPAAAWSGDKYTLDEPVDDVRIYGVGTRVDITGKVQMAPKEPQLPQSLSAALSYRERRLLGPGSEAETLRAVREYETAQADINVGGVKTTSRLPEGLKLIVAQGRTEGVELYGVTALLTANELDLIRSPADSLALISLLPAKKEIEVGEKWTVPGWAFQMLTGLDAIIKGELVCTLDAVEKGIARIKMNGKLEGAAVGSTTEVSVSGFFTYNLEGKFIAETDFVQTETRAVGPISPGLDITARIRLLRQPAKASGRLGDQKVIDAAANEPQATAKFLRFESPWNISGQHSRNWHLFQVDDKLAKFRLLDEGNLIAQCDMAVIASAKPGEHLSEQTFLTDIRKSLGDRLRTINKGEVVASSDRKFIYKVSAEGVAGDRNVTWIFYLVADPSGRQASLMVVLYTDLMDKLLGHDRELVDSLKFGPAPATRAANK